MKGGLEKGVWNGSGPMERVIQNKAIGWKLSGA